MIVEYDPTNNHGNLDVDVLRATYIHVLRKTPEKALAIPMPERSYKLD